MSHILPDRPNLDHLKRQAKDRLRQLQAASPGARLADAQHALARDYGFASWPKLKAHVEAQARTAPAPQGEVFQSFTMRARQAAFFSRFEAAQAGSPLIETEHFVAGLVRAPQGLTAPAIDVPFASLQAEIDALTTKAEPLPTTVVIPFSDGTKQVIHRAAVEADQRQHQRIGTVHLLLGVLRDTALTGARALSKCGVTYATLDGDPAAFAGDE